MRPQTSFVNRYVHFYSGFPQHLFLLFLYSYKAASVHLLWKNHHFVILF